MDVVFFDTPAEFRTWLEAHHDSAAEVWVGFYKKDSGKTSITYHEALDEALCFGWIDGVRKTVDALSYCNRFSPRKKGSIWSAVNIAKVEALTAQGRMHFAGLKVFNERDPEKTNLYSFEQQSAKLDDTQEAQFKTNAPAWAYFSAQPPGYRKVAIWWVISAKKPETRERRLASLIEHSAQGKKLPNIARPEKS